MNFSTGGTASLPNVTVIGNIAASDGDGKDGYPRVRAVIIPGSQIAASDGDGKDGYDVAGGIACSFSDHL